MLSATEKEAALLALWSTWSTPTLKAFCEALTTWYAGKAYMYWEGEEFHEDTPLDTFARAYPTEFAKYNKLIDTKIACHNLPLYRSVLFEQADDLVYYIEESGLDISSLVDALEYQNTLSFMPFSIDPIDFLDVERMHLDVRTFSSWTLNPTVAYKLGHEGGMYQIGEGSVIVRATAPVHIAHTIFAGKVFDKLVRQSKLCSPFIASWAWQKEYVVYAPNLKVPIDGLLVASVHGYEYYNRIYALFED